MREGSEKSLVLGYLKHFPFPFASWASDELGRSFRDGTNTYSTSHT